MGISWQNVEDACTENLELAGVIRQLERLHGGDTPIDWSEPRERCVEVLEVFRAGHQPSEDLTSLFEGTEYEVGGGNVRIVDGKPVLFDAIAMLASKMVVAWVASQKC